MNHDTTSGYRSARRRGRSIAGRMDGAESKRRLFINASRSDGIIRVGPAIAAGRGFTLVEVLLATVLLAAGLALAFTTLGAATTTVQRGEVLAQRSQHLRAVEGFLRERLTGARMLAFAHDEVSGVPQRFVGEPQRMRFVANLPAYLGHGGPYLHDLHIARDEDGRGLRLLLDLHVVQAGATMRQVPERAPEQLSDDLRSILFRYRGLDDTGQLGDWTTHWQASARLPLQVEIQLRGESGRYWPPLLVALPLARNVAPVITQ